jgi:hypothetical protein
VSLAWQATFGSTGRTRRRFRTRAGSCNVGAIPQPHTFASPAGPANAAARPSTLDHCLVPRERVGGLDAGHASSPRPCDARDWDTDRPETARRQFGLTNARCQSRLTAMNAEDIASATASNDPSLGLRAALALHRLAERVEADHVATARQQGWSWQQIGDALGVTRQSVHAKYGKRLP